MSQRWGAAGGERIGGSGCEKEGGFFIGGKWRIGARGQPFEAVIEIAWTNRPKIEKNGGD